MIIMDEIDPNAIQAASLAITSASLGIARTLSNDKTLRNSSSDVDALAAAPGSNTQDDTQFEDIPSEFHDPNVPASPLEALQSHGPIWALSVMRQVLLARWQLRRCDFLGKWVRVRGRVRIHNEGRIMIADRVRFRAETAKSELVAWKDGTIEIGEGTTINYGSSVSAASTVKIGSNCLIGAYVNIMDCNFHNVKDHSWNMDAKPIVIGDNVWLGNRSVITKGVTIGSGAVVAASSLVTKDVPPNTLVVGVPARIVQHL